MHELVPVNDRDFLLFVYVTICAHLKQPTGWYFSPEASKTIKHVRKWMEIEDGNEEATQKAAEATKTIAEPLSTVLTETSTIDVCDAEHDSDDSDDLDE